MKNSISIVTAFLLGVAAGGVSVWLYRRENYISLEQHEDEVASVKASYSKYEDKAEQKKASAVENKYQDKGSISEYAKRVQTEGYTEYSRTVNSKDKPSSSVPEPYVISPDEFGEIEEYTKISLTYFTDGILADEYGDVVDDVEEIIGDGLNHFGEYEDDSVFVRNDPKRCDYEILKDLRTFETYLATLPPKPNKEG